MIMHFNETKKRSMSCDELERIDNALQVVTGLIKGCGARAIHRMGWCVRDAADDHCEGESHESGSFERQVVEWLLGPGAEMTVNGDTLMVAMEYGPARIVVSICMSPLAPGGLAESMALFDPDTEADAA